MARPMSPRGDPDPRVAHAPVDDVPRLLREGAGFWNARDHWRAHESWESAWHALRAAGRSEEAEFVHGLILVTAGFENLARGKLDGFVRQVASGLARLREHRGGGTRVGISNEEEFREGVTDLLLGVASARVPSAAGAARAAGAEDVVAGLRVPLLRVGE